MTTQRYKVNVGPPPKPNRKEWPFVGTIRFAGMVIHVENLPGSVREGTGPGGKKWRTKMKHPYGEIHKTKGLDGDKVDVYVGPDSSSKKVYVVNQNHPKGHPKAGQFDEEKVMLGFSNASAARRAYLAHYDNDSFFRSITEMGMDEFKKSVYKEDKGEKIAEAYEAGFKRALVDVKYAKAEETGTSWWAPLLGAGLIGGGAYGLARLPMLTKKYPALRAIQEAAGKKMLRSDIGEFQKVDLGSLSKMERLKRFLKYGPEGSPEELIKATEEGVRSKKPAAIFDRSMEPMKGSFNPALGTTSGGREATRAAERIESLGGDKLLESQLLAKHAPGAMADTVALEDFMKTHGLKLRRGKSFESDLQKIEDTLKKNYGEGYLIKTRGQRIGGDIGAASSGSFPTEQHSLLDLHQQWQKMKPQFRKAYVKAKNPVEAVEQFRNQEGFRGRIIEEMLNKNTIIQKKLPLVEFPEAVAKKMRKGGYGGTKEYRVHALGGKALPGMATPRYPSGWRTIPEMWKAQKARKWFQKEVLNKLPEEYRHIGYGADVAPLEGGGFKVIELNPGGDSGLLATNPFGVHGLYRAVTGRYSQPAAATLGGIGALVGGGLGAALGPDSTQNKTNDQPEDLQHKTS